MKKDVNPRLAAMLKKLDADREELARRNAEFRESNDRFARSLRQRGVPSVPPPPPPRRRFP